MSTSEDENLLELFNVIEEKPDTTQRDLAGRLGIALGMTNTLLRRAAHQGWLSVRKRERGRQSYHLTDQGLIEKGRLMMGQIQSTLKFYGEARRMAAEVLQALKGEGITRIAIAGTSNVSEVIFLSAREVGLEVVAFVDDSRRRGRWLDVPRIFVAELAQCGAEMLILDALKRDEIAEWESVDFPKRVLEL